jgi:hypothetical protein
LLSELTPPAPGAEDSFPQLIICAAANVSDVGASPAGSDVLSLTLTGTELAVSGADGASIATHVLERMQRPSSVRSGWGPAMTLASATAMTGAAVSPAMGKQTRNNLRALFAALNIRLGVWLPNPINPSVRDRIADAVAGADAGNGVRPRRGLGWLIQMVPDLADRVDTANPMPAEERATILAERRRVRVGINEMVQELFGLHPSGGTKLYVSDGGHYDNLGLVELLRRRCSVVWVVDASGDRPGTARALSEAILLAGAEVGANVDLDLDRFALDKETDRQGPVLGATHVLGDVRYGDDSRAWSSSSSWA